MNESQSAAIIGLLSRYVAVVEAREARLGHAHVETPAIDDEEFKLAAAVDLMNRVIDLLDRGEVLTNAQISSLLECPLKILSPTLTALIQRGWIRCEGTGASATYQASKVTT